MFAEHVSEAGNAAGGKGFDGTGGNRINPNPVPASSYAKYLTVHSRAALATAITL